MRIAYLNSICQQYDAISNAIRDEIAWLREAGHEVRLFAYACEFPEVPFTRVDNDLDVAFDPYFQQCDLALFHFGVYYPMFNLLPLVPRRARRVVVFHNVTPRAHLPASSHALIDKSMAQVSNMAFADHVICDSHTNMAVLREAGVQVPATELPLAVDLNLRAPAAKPSAADGVVRIAFVGRLVQSKGPLDLLAAVDSALAARCALRVQLDLVANISFSDGAVVERVRAGLADLENRYGARMQARLHGNAPEPLKQELLADADLFVLPTHHEGFCVPILEALASGCRVICYDNSNTPAVSGGLATLVPTGDVAALSAAVGTGIDTVQGAAWRTGGYAGAVQAAAVHLARFAPAAVRKRFLEFISRQPGYSL